MKNLANLPEFFFVGKRLLYKAFRQMKQAEIYVVAYASKIYGIFP